MPTMTTMAALAAMRGASLQAENQPAAAPPALRRAAPPPASFYPALRSCEMTMAAGLRVPEIPWLSFQDFPHEQLSQTPDTGRLNRHRDADRPLFDLGQLVTTPAAEKVLEDAGLNLFWLVGQHRHGQWGDLVTADSALNDQALLNGGRLHSAYFVKNVMLFVVTEAINKETGQRERTCVLLPSE